MFSFKKSKLAVLLVIALMAIVTVVGCSSTKEQPKEDAAKQQSSESKVSGTVKVAGSTSVQPLAEELAELFTEKNPDITVSVQGGGSSAGIEAANTKTAQIGTSSREIKDEEKSYGLTETVIAKDGIAVIVNSENQAADLTLEQVKKIFSGEIKDWSEVGGKKAGITVIVREEGSGTRGAFEEMVLGKDAKFITNAVVQNSTGAVKTAVTKDPNAVGFISLGSVDSAVKALKVNGAQPSEATVLDGSYKISRPFLFLTNGDVDDATKAYIDFILSPEGQKVVSEHYVKVK